MQSRKITLSPVRILGTALFVLTLAGVSSAVAGLAPTGLQQEISGGVLNGKAITLPKPAYPEAARAARAAGPVQVQVTIDEEGNVIVATAVSGHELLRAAAVDAARGAKFSPTKLNGVPVKVAGTIIYNFVAGPESEGEATPLETATDLPTTKDQPARLGTLTPDDQNDAAGVLNARAITLPVPAYPLPARQAHASGPVKVQVVIDEEGNIIEAMAVSGNLLLRAAAVEAARGARFDPPKLNGVPVRVTGYILYNFLADGPPQEQASAPATDTAPEAEPGSTPKPTIVMGGILNGKAISLPRPIYPAAARDEHASGTVEVEITIDEEGNVIEAAAIKGHKLLRTAAVEAAREAKFTPTKLSGVPVKVTGRIIYNFTVRDY